MAYTKKIEIQQHIEAQDTIGNDTYEWETLYSPWAKIEENATGKEYYEAAQTNSENDVIFKVRYSSKLEGKLTSELRIKYKNAYYDVKHMDGMEEHSLEVTIRTVKLNGGVR